MICRNCGNEIDDIAVVCPYCGTPANSSAGQSFSNGTGEEQKANVGFIILAVLFPIVGVILGIVEMNKGNKKVGKTYLFTALIAWVVSFVLGCCIGGLLAFLPSGSSYSSSYYAMMPFFFV